MTRNYLTMLLFVSANILPIGEIYTQNLNLDFDSMFKLNNNSTTVTYYAVVIPEFSIWELVLLFLSVTFVLMCCAFCVYYPFAATLEH